MGNVDRNHKSLKKVELGTAPSLDEFSDQKEMLRSVGKIVLIVILAGLLLGYGSTCFRQVKVQETGVLMRFGRVIQDRVDPGICLKMPWPIDRLITVKTQTIETKQAGFGISPDQ